MGNAHNGILFSNKEEQNNIIYKKMEGPGELSEISQSQKEKGHGFFSYSEARE